MLIRNASREGKCTHTFHVIAAHHYMSLLCKPRHASPCETVRSDIVPTGARISNRHAVLENTRCLVRSFGPMGM